MRPSWFKLLGFEEHSLNSKLYENSNNNIESSLELTGNALSIFNYYLRFDSCDGYNLSLNLKDFGFGISKIEDIKKIAFWKDIEIYNQKFNINYRYTDNNSTEYHDSSLVYKMYQKLNIGAYISYKSNNFDKVAIGFDSVNSINFDKIELNYIYDKNSISELENYFKFKLDDLNFESYINYDQIFRSIHQIRRNIKN